MAKMFGQKSGYLVRKMWANFSKAFILNLVMVILLILSTYFIYKFGFPKWGSWVLLIYLPIFVYYKNKAEKFFNGLMGEDKIKKELQKLPDECSVFQDIKLPGINSNIDFVVLGPTGIFTIEVKSHHGKIGFNGHELMLNGHEFKEKDILRQSMSEAMSLHNYLLNSLKADIFIHPVLAFSNYVEINFGNNAIHNVAVLGKSFLNQYISSQLQYSYPMPKKEIEDLFKNLSI
jgi:hypothetical protein